ncbi:MAG: hypothetical protein WCK67_02070 [bacterium]
MDMNKLIHELEKDINIGKYISKEVIIKYIGTLRLADIKIQKPTKINDYSYTIEKAITLINLSPSDIKIFATLYFISKKLSQKKIIKNTESLLSTLLKFLPAEHNEIFKKYLKELSETKYKHEILEKVIPEELTQKIEKLEKFCNEDMRSLVSYLLPNSNKQIELVFEPKYIKYEKTSIYLAGYNFITGEKQLLDIKNIDDIKQLPVKSKYNNILSPIIFKLRGKIAHSYRIYEGEKITEKNGFNSEITVTSYIEDKDLLLKRLLKYGDACEIIYPAYIREEVKNILLKSLANYN